MDAYWIAFEDGSAACYEAQSPEDARGAASKDGAVSEIAVLPYPADPRKGNISDCPSFCYRPRECKGNTACPRPRSCTE